MRSSSAKRAEPLVPLGRASAEYEVDFYTWAMEQARLVREGRLDGLDAENIAEELETLGRGEQSGLESALARVIQHLLKWDHQPERRSRSWIDSIDIHRIHAARRLDQNPGLKGRLDRILAAAYRLAVAYAKKDTRLPRSTFPEICPYTWEEIMTRELVLVKPDAS